MRTGQVPEKDPVLYAITYKDKDYIKEVSLGEDLKTLKRLWGEDNIVYWCRQGLYNAFRRGILYRLERDFDSDEIDFWIREVFNMKSFHLKTRGNIIARRAKLKNLSDEQIELQIEELTREHALRKKEKELLQTYEGHDENHNNKQKWYSLP